MRRIEEMMLNAINNDRSFSNSNTTVNVDRSGNVYVYLFGNCIYRIVDGVKQFTLAGWNTVTTRSRLNALGVSVSQKNWDPVYNGVVISSYNWYTV